MEFYLASEDGDILLFQVEDGEVLIPTDTESSE